MSWLVITKIANFIKYQISFFSYENQSRRRPFIFVYVGIHENAIHGYYLNGNSIIEKDTKRGDIKVNTKGGHIKGYAK